MATSIAPIPDYLRIAALKYANDQLKNLVLANLTANMNFMNVKYIQVFHCWTELKKGTYRPKYWNVRPCPREKHADPPLKVAKKLSQKMRNVLNIQKIKLDFY